MLREGLYSDTQCCGTCLFCKSVPSCSCSLTIMHASDHAGAGAGSRRVISVICGDNGLILSDIGDMIGREQDQ
jgi:hypothetical protein